MEKLLNKVQELVKSIKEYRDLLEKGGKRETVEEFKARGGKIKKLPPSDGGRLHIPEESDEPKETGKPIEKPAKKPERAPKEDKQVLRWENPEFKEDKQILRWSDPRLKEEAMKVDSNGQWSLEKAWLKPGKESEASMEGKDPHPTTKDYKAEAGKHGDLSFSYQGHKKYNRAGENMGSHRYTVHHKGKEIGHYQVDDDEDGGMHGGDGEINGKHLFEHKDFPGLQDKVIEHKRKLKKSEGLEKAWLKPDQESEASMEGKDPHPLLGDKKEKPSMFDEFRQHFKNHDLHNHGYITETDSDSPDNRIEIGFNFDNSDTHHQNQGKMSKVWDIANNHPELEHEFGDYSDGHSKAVFKPKQAHPHVKTVWDALHSKGNSEEATKELKKLYDMLKEKHEE